MFLETLPWVWATVDFNRKVTKRATEDGKITWL
jgi:hypothetical protein